MLEQAKAKIYLASERGHTETDWFRRYNTFNFGDYQNPAKQPFESLYVWNDDTLAGGRSVQLTVDDDSCILLLPVVGAVAYNDSTGNEAVVEAGQSLVVQATKGITIELSNPYEDGLINFLHGWMKTEAVVATNLSFFSLDENQNRLVNATEACSPFRCMMGKYDGRREETYKPSTEGKAVFIFVIQGAFEVQNRLLEARDGLGLWNVDEIEFEALSNEAVLLILEITATQ